jgi:hypothetical protein
VPAAVVYVLSRVPIAGDSYVVDVFADFNGAQARAIHLQQDGPGQRWAEAVYDPAAGRARWYDAHATRLDIQRWPVIA